MKDIHDKLVANLNDREEGKVLCAVQDIASIPNVDLAEPLRSFVAQTYGLHIGPDSLRSLSREEAVFIATELLRGPAWGPPVVARSIAERDARTFIDRFDDSVVCQSTYEISIDHEKGTYTMMGVSLLGNSFELGFLLRDRARVGILWMGDED